MRIATPFLAVVLLAAAPAAAADQEIQISGAAGWGGRVVRGEHAPILVDLDNRGKKDVEFTLAATWAAGFANQSSESPSFDTVFGRTGPHVLIPVTLPAKSRKRISLSLLTPDTSQISVWAFALDGRGRTLARGELNVRLVEPNKRVVGIVGMSRPDGIEEGGLELANIQPDELPEDWKGYNALEALVWMDGRATEIRSSAQVDALKHWISCGGTFCVARSNTVALAGTPIMDLLPAKVGASREIASLGGGKLPDGPTAILDLTPKKGAVRADTSGTPLVIEANRDGGRVIVAAFDPSKPPFRDWSGSIGFWKWLLDLSPPPPPTPLGQETPPRAIGSRLLAQEAGRFPDVAAPEIGGLFLLIVLYLVVVGPLDYLLLRWLKRLEYTWFTFPAYVLLFTLFILLVGGAFIQRAAHQREIAVVDHYLESGFTRRHALSAVLAPADVIYTVDDADPLSSNYLQNSRMFDAGGKTSDVRLVQHDGRRAENWLLNRNYTGLALADRPSSAPPPLTYAVTSITPAEVQVTVKNGTGDTFEGAVLIAGGRVYALPSIPPNDSALTASRLATSLEEYVQREGTRNLKQAVDQFGNPTYNPNRYGEYQAGGLTETDLNPIIRKALLGLSFPVRMDKSEEFDVVTGFSRGLDALRWARSGGCVLLAWAPKAEAVVRFDPKPGRFTSVTLYRFFQGPPP